MMNNLNRTNSVKRTVAVFFALSLVWSLFATGFDTFRNSIELFEKGDYAHAQAGFIFCKSLPDVPAAEVDSWISRCQNKLDSITLAKANAKAAFIKAAAQKAAAEDKAKAEEAARKEYEEKQRQREKDSFVYVSANGVKLDGSEYLLFKDHITKSVISSGYKCIDDPGRSYLTVYVTSIPVIRGAEGKTFFVTFNVYVKIVNSLDGTILYNDAFTEKVGKMRNYENAVRAGYEEKRHIITPISDLIIQYLHKD